MSTPLARRQRDFAGWVTAAEPPASTPELLGDERAGAAERLAIYRNAYAARILDALRDDYPALARALGAARFDVLATAYLRAHPSQHPSLRHAGARLPEFLAARAELCATAPWSPCLARLELAVVDAFDAADAPPLSRADLIALPPEYWDALPLALLPGVQPLAFAWPVRALRAAHDAEQPLALEALAPAQERVLVWRRDERVLHRPCGEEEFALLARVASGLRFGGLCALLAETRGEALGAERAASLLAGWVDEELLLADVR